MRRLLVVASLALLIQTGMAQSPARHKPQPLSDAAMDRVTAGGITAGMSDGVIQFQGSGPTKNGRVTGEGTLGEMTGPLAGTTQNPRPLTLNAGAQKELNPPNKNNPCKSN